jgi:hypothetical protein
VRSPIELDPRAVPINEATPCKEVLIVIFENQTTIE